MNLFYGNRFGVLLLCGVCSVMSISLQAQNYQCLQSGARHYYTNESGYLRGMRIDHVETSGDTTFYYPFHTDRGSYLALSPAMDTAGSSWLGGKVAALADGTWVFDNLWHNAVIIKTQAMTGDSWLLAADTTGYYYKAGVTATEPMDVLGTSDTVKTITISAYNPDSTVNTADSVNGLQLLLSQNYGFVQALDLYTFPYHTAGMAYIPGADYYLDASCNTVFTKSNCIFRLIDFHNPKKSALYHSSPGDVFEYYTEGPGTGYTHKVDSIVAKTASSAYDTVYCHHSWTEIYTYGMPTTTYTVLNAAEDTSNAKLVDEVLMPEEWGVHHIYHYRPDDSSYCARSATYEVAFDNIYADGTISAVSPCDTDSEGYTDAIYKVGFGLTSYYICGGPGTASNTYMTYASKDGSACGTYTDVLAVNSAAKNNTVQIFPNPASDEVIIKTVDNHYTTATITNSLGQSILQQKLTGNETHVDVQQLSSGVYVITLRGRDGAFVERLEKL